MSIHHPSFGKLDDDQVIMFDTTLRDGEQSPGFSMTLEEKLRMADALHELGTAFTACAPMADDVWLHAVALRHGTGVRPVRDGRTA